MAKSYFCWERGIGMRWIPVLYVTRKPDALVGYSKEDPPRRSAIHEVEAGSSLDDLVKTFPAPAQ